ncbi:hypothetical protein [Sphingobacterium lactis]|uniref:hypothetical protein n=1 Tax=Sphingobacterium lactis TaxID=797291 RepID=UPI003DA49EC0
MKHFSLVLLLFILFKICEAQNSPRPIHIGISAEMLLDAPSYDGYIGVSGKYDLSKKHNIQANLGIQSPNIAFIGGDYIYNFLSITDRVNLFTGAGLGVGFSKRENWSNVNLHAGVEFGVTDKFSIFTLYKIKYYLSQESLEPNWISIGLRYTL